MPIVKITGQGLSAIALSVALLWGCWFEERSVNRRAFTERARVMRELQQLQRTAQPASSPLNPIHRVPHVSAG